MWLKIGLSPVSGLATATTTTTALMTIITYAFNPFTEVTVYHRHSSSTKESHKITGEQLMISFFPISISFLLLKCFFFPFLIFFPVVFDGLLSSGLNWRSWLAAEAFACFQRLISMQILVHISKSIKIGSRWCNWNVYKGGEIMYNHYSLWHDGISIGTPQCANDLQDSKTLIQIYLGCQNMIQLLARPEANLKLLLLFVQRYKDEWHAASNILVLLA